MSLVSLFEFRKITGISDAALISLLEGNQIPLVLDSEKGIMLDINSAGTKHLVDAIVTQREDLLKEEQDVLVEKAARIMRENLRSLIDEALKRCAKHGSNQ